MSSPSSSSSIPTKKYHVFLSFRGADTRTNIAYHFFNSLQDGGFNTFRYNPRLETSKEIAAELLKAIQQSQCFVIVLSKNYASSSWCLMELVEILKLKKEQEGLEVFPIFYHVDPSDFRKQHGKVGEDISKHKEIYNEATIQTWRNALTEVANLSGESLKNDEDHEGKFVGEIVKKISEKLCQKHPIIHNGLVGIKPRLAELHSKMEIEKNDVRIIGICGMSGIGKTTLAEVAYNEMSPNFEGKSFIYDVREKSESGKDKLVSSQKKLLSDILKEEGLDFSVVEEGKAVISRMLSTKKVLIVLDDVDHSQQLECLVGRRDWFGSGSRIIVTTRDEHLLRRVDAVYKPTTLDDVDALRLFNLKAFGNDMVPNDEFMELSKDVVSYAGGLPLFLEVVGSLLRGADANVWRSTIERFKRDSDKEIHDRLRINFDELEGNGVGLLHNLVFTANVQIKR